MVSFQKTAWFMYSEKYALICLNEMLISCIMLLDAFTSLLYVSRLSLWKCVQYGILQRPESYLYRSMIQ